MTNGRRRSGMGRKRKNGGSRRETEKKGKKNLKKKILRLMMTWRMKEII
jgi:hypothetical protein